MPEPQVFTNPETGQEIRVVSASPETLVVESLMPPRSPQPPPHYHPSQDEGFEVLEGEVSTRIGGAERVYAAGESFEVPAGTVHEMSNRSPERPARLRWETRPALRTLAFFEALGELWQGRPADLSGFEDEIRFDVPS